MKKWIQNYIDAQKAALESVAAENIEEIITIIRSIGIDKRQIFVFGNGGSAANASHFAVDLGKGSSDAGRCRFRILSLNDNMPWMTALANDYDYEDVFVRQ